MRTALVIGATGLVGTALVELLIAQDIFQKVIIFTRRSLNIQHEKLDVHIIDFNQPDTWQHLVRGDVLFSTLGTTLKQAGSQAAQYRIDYTYQLDFAKAASSNGVPVYVLVSSASANPDSKLFYTRIKGELEREIKRLPFKSITVIQPSLLVGARTTERFGEKIGYRVLGFLNGMGLFKKYKPIHAGIVARAMINAALGKNPGVQTYSLDKIFRLGEKKRNADNADY